jgi:HMG (high mobility group) box
MMVDEVDGGTARCDVVARPDVVDVGTTEVAADASQPLQQRATLSAVVDAFVVEFLRGATDAPAAEALVRRWKAKDTMKRLGVALEPPKPKRVVSKYLYFCRRVRQQILTESPGTNIRDVTRELGRRWRVFQKAPDADVLSEISAEFQADATRYRKERAMHQSAAAKKRAAPKSPFIAFCSAERKRVISQQQQAGEDVIDMVRRLTLKELGARWRTVKADPIEYERYRAIAGCA